MLAQEYAGGEALINEALRCFRKACMPHPRACRMPYEHDTRGTRATNACDPS